MLNVGIVFVFDRKKKVKETGEGLVEIRLTYERKQSYISTGIKLRPKEWKSAKVVGRVDAALLNERLERLYKDVCMVVGKMEEAGLVDLASVRTQLARLKAADRTFVNYAEEQIEAMKISEGTRAHYKGMLEELKKFGGIVYLADLTLINIRKWDQWIRAKGIKESSVYNYHKTLRSLINNAVADGLVKNSPYSQFKPRRGDNEEEMRYLTEKQLKALVGLNIEDNCLSRVRDLFVFQACTGLAYSDMASFNRANCEETPEGIVYRRGRVKTGIQYVIRLLPMALQILDKYEWRLPVISNQKYNLYLRVVGKMIGIEGLHSHMARHTFATMMLSKGARIENVSKMLGHTNIRQTQRYAKVLAKDVLADMDAVTFDF